jgi:DNA-binding Xre family transcriptional regulator
MKREIKRRDVHAELIHHTTLVRAMEFRRVGVREFADQVGVSNQVLAAMRTGRMTRCTPELARLIEEGLGLEPGSLFVLKVKAAAQRSTRREPRVQGEDVA